jgi:hypothetical protein
LEEIRLGAGWFEKKTDRRLGANDIQVVELEKFR